VERVVSSPWAFFVFLIVVIGFVAYLVLNMKYKHWSKISALILLVSPFIPWGLVLPTRRKDIPIVPSIFPVNSTLAICWCLLACQ
jgi:predicted ferric reductase